MNRSKKLKINTVSGLCGQIVTLTCGFIVPKLILNTYGSDVNGLVSSITRFLSFISLAECGVGAVVQSALYKPLAEKDYYKVSKIIISSERFFRKVGMILIIYIGVLIALYPSIINKRYSFFYTASLIIAISISSYVQYFFCMSYRLLLTADQVGYIQTSLQIITIILNTIFCVILSRAGASIQTFKLVTSLIFLLQPLGLAFYVKKNYKINKKIKFTDEPISQKWNGLSQHVAYVVLENTDTVVLTLLSSLSNVSIYNVYFLVVNGIKCMINVVISGAQSFLGNMYAKDEKDELVNAFSIYEWSIHTVVTFLFTCTAILIVPFVKIYTYGITDANYIDPLFGNLMALAQAMYCLRIPYNSIVFAAGHYKQTQISALIEALINIIVSVVLVFKYGIIGVAIGTFIAMSYRTVYLVFYLKKNIIMRPIKHFIRYIVVDIVIISISYLLTINLEMNELSYVSWFILGIKVAIIVATITFLVNFLLYNKLIRVLLSNIKN